jgi:coproporphyrinogen III oxidase-like Fe-S oxidoreductase
MSFEPVFGAAVATFVGAGVAAWSALVQARRSRAAQARAFDQLVHDLDETTRRLSRDAAVESELIRDLAQRDVIDAQTVEVRLNELAEEIARQTAVLQEQISRLALRRSARLEEADESVA